MRLRYTEVERANLTDGIISANEAPKGLIIQRARAYNFVLRKDPDGRWRLLTQ